MDSFVEAMGDDFNPYEDIARAQKEKVQEHIQRRQKAFITRVDSQQLSQSASYLIKRQSFHLGGAAQPARENEKMFEHFIVVGYPPNMDPVPPELETTNPTEPTQNEASPSPSISPRKRGASLPSQQPQILFQYPSAPLSNTQVAFFCFPDGVSPSLVDMTHSMSDLHSVMFGSLSTLEDSEHSYLFLMNGGDAVLYGVCVVQSELLNQTPSFFLDPIGPTRSTGPAENITASSPEVKRNMLTRRQVTAPRCYCLISRFPFFKLHFDVLYSLLALERLKVFSKGTESERPPGPNRKGSLAVRGPGARKQLDLDLSGIRENEKTPSENVRIGTRGSVVGLTTRRPLPETYATPLEEPSASERLQELKRKRKELKERLLNDSQDKAHSSREALTSSARVALPDSRPPPQEERHQTVGRKLGMSGRLIDSETRGPEKDLLEVLRAASKLRKKAQQLPQIYHYKMDNEVMKVLCSYRKTRVSLKELTFQLPGELRHYHFTCPEGNVDKLLADWCLISLFRFFSLSDVLTILQYCLLEKKIIFICKNLGVLSNIVMSLIPLLRPFVWQDPFIPILPESLEECVQSPVPYIIGTKELSAESLEAIAGECLLINVDAYTFQYPSSLPPELPYRADFLSALEQDYITLHPELKLTPESPRPSKNGAAVPTTPQAARKSSTPSPVSSVSTTPQSPRKKTPPVSVPPKSEPQPSTPAPSKGGWRNIFSRKSAKTTSERPATLDSPEHDHLKRDSMSRSAPTLTTAAKDLKKSKSVSEMRKLEVTQPKTTELSRKKRSSWFNIKTNEIIRTPEEEYNAEVEREKAQHTPDRTKKSTKPVVNPSHVLFPTKASKEDSEAVQGLLRKIQEYHKDFVNRIVNHSEWNTDWTSPQAVEEVVKRFPRSEQEFMRLFFETQTFIVFTEKLLDISWKVKVEQNRKMLEQVEEKIIQEEEQKAAAFSVLQIYSSEGSGKKKGSRGPDETRLELEETINCVDMRISALEQAKVMLAQEGKQLVEEKRSMELKKRMATLL